MTALGAIGLSAGVVAIGFADLRWFRVAQREHYLAGSASRFFWRWWTVTPLNAWLGLVAVAAAAGAIALPALAIVTGTIIAGAPLGLGLRGRTSRLAWTRRMSLIAVVTVVLEGLTVGLCAGLGGLSDACAAAALCAIVSAVYVDASLLLLHPLEDVVARRYVRRAVTVLERVRPIVVAITGSYGKTTTKNYVAYLLAADRSVVASPRSYNNRAGLSRTVNEHLVPGTDVLVAEMGAYGKGEIAALCEWIRPEIAVITSIGPAHLERFRTLERTLEAKSEIAAAARVVVLNVDDVRLAGLAKRLDASRKVVRVSGVDADADVAVLEHPDGIELRVGGQLAGLAVLDARSAPPIRTNAACAVAVALELGMSAGSLVTRLGSLPGVPNRLQLHEAEGGYVVLDDTFNSNPAGARHALEVLKAAAPQGRRMLVTPGMVELGKTQAAENAAFAELGTQIVTDLVVVGRTNRTAIVRGCRRAAAPPPLKLVSRREQGVAWARAKLGPGDAVLFENDLPDHFP